MALPRTSLLLVLAVAACGGGSRAAPTDPAAARLAEASARCPVGELDPQIAVVDDPDGAVITFTTPGLPERLRSRVFALADTHNDVHSEMGPLPQAQANTPGAAAPAHVEAPAPDGAVHAGMAPMAAAPASEGDGERAAMLTVHSRARAEEVPAGARIVFVADPDDVDELRDELRERAAEIARDCEAR